MSIAEATSAINKGADLCVELCMHKAEGLLSLGRIREAQSELALAPPLDLCDDTSIMISVKDLKIAIDKAVAEADELLDSLTKKLAKIKEGQGLTVEAAQMQLQFLVKVVMQNIDQMTDGAIFEQTFAIFEHIFFDVLSILAFTAVDSRRCFSTFFCWKNNCFNKEFLKCIDDERDQISTSMLRPTIPASLFEDYR